MMHGRNLIESRPFLSRVPDQTIIAGDPGVGVDHKQATRGDRYAWYYLPCGGDVDVRLGAVSGTRISAWWFDPRTGAAACIGEFENSGVRRFAAPGEKARGNDWVLALNDCSRGYAAPGTPAPDQADACTHVDSDINCP